MEEITVKFEQDQNDRMKKRFKDDEDPPFFNDNFVQELIKTILLLKFSIVTKQFVYDLIMPQIVLQKHSVQFRHDVRNFFIHQ